MSIRRQLSALLCVAALLLVAACSANATPGGSPAGGPPAGANGANGGTRGGSATTPASSNSSFTSSSAPIPTSTALVGLDLSALPLGDNHTTTSGPQANDLYVCTTAPFRQGGGAAFAGPWIHSNGTYDLGAKVHADGNLSWPAHALSITVNGATRVVHTNDLPSVPTGIFPILPSTAAYQYDHNPNSIQAQDITLNLPANPSAAAQPSCLAPGGTIGVMLDGVTLFNGVDAAGRDAVAHEVQDGCWGHPEKNGDYHYHSLSPCMDIGSLGAGTSPLLGYALDGYGIYGPFQDGKLVTNSELDACHGTTSPVLWDGKMVTMYHYVANFQFPYTIGCYHGTPAQTGRPQP